MRIYLIVIILLSNIFLFGQTEILLKNPSFEGFAEHSIVPSDWFNCGTALYSPPDLHSINTNFFKVKHDSYDGSTYVGMVVREDNSWEAIGQWLDEPMQSGVLYEFSIYLARAKDYKSLSRVTLQEENFDKPTVLRIWGSNNRLEGEQLLAESIPIQHTNWQQYTFEFIPEKDWEYFILEAYYESNSLAYDGNLLLDKCSSLFSYEMLEGILEKEVKELSNSDLLDLIIRCKTDDANLSDTSFIDVVYDSWFFDTKSESVGLKNLVIHSDSTRIKHYCEVYQKLGLQQTIEILQKTVRLLDKEALTTKEKRFLKNCEKLFKNTLITEKIDDKRLNYIRLHREEIIELLKACSF